MYQEILINVESQEKRVAILENKNLEEFYVERQDRQRLVGNIYKGVVDSIVPAIGAAFVRIGLSKNGFLYIQDLTAPDYEKIAELIDVPLEGKAANSEKPNHPVDIREMLKVGQEILVQVVKEPIGTKGPRLTTHITFPGRYLVLMPCDKHLGISRKIQDTKERMRLKELLRNLKIPQEMGVIIRTVGSGSGKKELLQDLNYLSNLWRRIKLTSHKKTAPSLIHEEYDLVLRTIRDNFTPQVNRLQVDSKEEYKRIMRFLSIFSPKLKNRVQVYSVSDPLFEKKGVEEEIAKIYDRKVSLKSGGHLVIEPTESLVAIDVNSGRFTEKQDPEETAYQVNLEAAKEISRQMRLRDIGGIIIIDFIDMKLSKHRKRVFDVLKESVKRDHAKTDILTVSSLGLVEMTRQRVRKSIESVAYQSCPYCQGKGLVKSPATMSILALREIAKRLQPLKIEDGFIEKKVVLVYMHPKVATYLLNENRAVISELENRFKSKILIKQDVSAHMEELKIEIS